MGLLDRRQIVLVILVSLSLVVVELRTRKPIQNASNELINRPSRILQTLGQVDRFVLINADTDLPILDMVNGTVINVATQNTSNFTIQAIIVNNSGAIGSIKFGYNTRPAYRIDIGPLFALCGDGNPLGNYFTCTNLTTPAAYGALQTVSATPYSGAKANGTKGITKMISFRIVNIPPTIAPTPAPTAAPTSAPTTEPTTKPSEEPSMEPSIKPSALPSIEPSSEPSIWPSQQPSTAPSAHPTLPICNVPQVSMVRALPTCKKSTLAHDCLFVFFDTYSS